MFCRATIVADWKASFRATAVGALASTAIGLVAFFFLTSGHHPTMGGVLFVMVPLVAGFSISLVARQHNSVVAATLVSVLCSLVLLIALGKEGLLCAALAFPIIVAGFAIGAVIGFRLRKLLANRARNPIAPTGLLLNPLIEKRLGSRSRSASALAPKPFRQR